MSYITQQDLQDELGLDRLIQYTDDTEAGVVGVPAVNKAIGYAVGKFEAFIRGRYTLPVPATEMVKSSLLDVAVFHLVRKRSTLDEGLYKIARDAHDDAIKLWQAVQAGKAALDVPAAQETKASPASADEVLSGPSRPSAFSDEKLRSF